MSGNGENGSKSGQRSMEVTVVVDEDGNLRVMASAGMNVIEIKSMLTSAFQSVEDRIQKDSRVIIPKSAPFVVAK